MAPLQGKDCDEATRVSQSSRRGPQTHTSVPKPKRSRATTGFGHRMACQQPHQQVTARQISTRLHRLNQALTDRPFITYLHRPNHLQQQVREAIIQITKHKGYKHNYQATHQTIQPLNPSPYLQNPGFLSNVRSVHRLRCEVPPVPLLPLAQRHQKRGPVG